MARPKKERAVRNPPKVKSFKPVGVPARAIKRTTITLDEYEAIRLVDYVGVSHKEAAERMEISRPTLTKLTKSARKKVAQSLIEGNELFIKGGSYAYRFNLLYCKKCNDYYRVKFGKEKAFRCPDCDCNDLTVVGPRRGRGRKRGRRGKRWNNQ